MTVASRCDLVGGPFCGRSIHRRGAVFIWVTMLRDAHRTVRVYDEPGVGRLLYRRVDDAHYLYAGHVFRRCEACGQMAPSASSTLCRLCGGRLVKT